MVLEENNCITHFIVKHMFCAGSENPVQRIKRFRVDKTFQWYENDEIALDQILQLLHNFNCIICMYTQGFSFLSF